MHGNVVGESFFWSRRYARTKRVFVCGENVCPTTVSYLVAALLLQRVVPALNDDCPRGHRSPVDRLGRANVCYARALLCSSGALKTKLAPNLSRTRSGHDAGRVTGGPGGSNLRPWPGLH